MRFLECQNSLKYVFGRGSVSDPTGEAYSAPSDLLGGLRRPIFMGRERRGERDRRKREKRGESVKGKRAGTGSPD